jgi:hypothetical protein
MLAVVFVLAVMRAAPEREAAGAPLKTSGAAAV